MSTGTRTQRDDNPIVRYADKQLWGNPEIDQQFQVHMEKFSPDLGYINTFNYMGCWRSTPKAGVFYHMFTVGGLHPGFWNFKTEFRTRNPLDKWIRVDHMGTRRGVQVDLYNTKGFMFPRCKAWVMATYDGLFLMAIEKLTVYPIPLKSDMYFRCYTPTVIVTDGNDAKNDINNPYIYETMTYENTSELSKFQSRYLQLKQRGGFTGLYVNGVFYNKAPNTLQYSIGDEVEIWHDPTVKRIEYYNYNTLRDFYSDLDQKRKLIIHPPKENDFTLRYFDDNDYYLLGKDSKGLYFHRNSVTAIRQLTHVDVAIADDQIQMASEYIPSLNNLSDVRIMVIVRDTSWDFEWPYEHQRYQYLYRLDDEGILSAMTGERSTVPEWTANGLENGCVQLYVRNQFDMNNTTTASEALGYNAMTRVVSETPVRVTYEEGGRGIRVPDTYIASYTVYEYDENGCLIEYYHMTNSRYLSPRNENCTMVEFGLGEFGRELDYVITNKSLKLRYGYDYRVYVSAYNIDSKEIVGDLVDVTGTDVYVEVNGYIVWKDLDVVNQRGVVVFNDKFLSYTFELDHIDHSLSFAITHIYEEGGLIFPLAFADQTVWLNGHPLIDNVDWIFDYPNIYIINKQFIVDGPQQITFRAYGFNDDPHNPKTDTELGFVEGGVIGNVPRYNIRRDRVTRTVINGALYITDEVPRAEEQPSSDLWDDLNGRPYMVKHVYCPVKFVEDYHTYPLYERSRELDRRVVDYLTLYAEKPTAEAIADLQDKYRLFSPFMNQVVNDIVNGFIIVPELRADADAFSYQTIYDLIKGDIWWLEYDPAALGFDLRYFAIMPYANYEKVTVTPDEFVFIKQVNDYFLKSVCSIEGNFEVSNNV